MRRGQVVRWSDGQRGRGTANRGEKTPLTNCPSDHLTIWAALALSALLLATLPASAAAQNDSRLLGAVRLAQEGRSDSARTRLQKLLEQTPATDSLYPEILYTMGMVASSAQERQIFFQRVTVEYSSSSWADEALFRLAQVTYAGGDAAGAARYLDRIRADYPTSSLLGAASYWAAKAHFESNDPAAGCRWVQQGLSRIDSRDVEARRQLEFFRQSRCRAGGAAAGGAAAGGAAAGDRAAGGEAAGRSTNAAPAPAMVPAAPGDTTAVSSAPRDTIHLGAAPDSGAKATPAAISPAAAPPAAVPPASAAPAFHVQVGALKTRDAADRLIAKLKAMELDAVVVEEGGYLKVRAGAFATRADASAAAQRIKARLGGAPFVVAGK